MTSCVGALTDPTGEIPVGQNINIFQNINILMIDYLHLPIGERCPDLVNAVIEVPRGGVNKYEYDKKLNVFRLDRTLYSPVHYPGDYGFIPSTLGSDGDPLDVLVLVDNASFPGCLMEVQPIGVLEMLDQGVRDEKVLAVVNNDPRYTEVSDYTDIYTHILREVEHFFSIYKDLEGKRTKTIAWHSAEEARRVILESQERFADRKAA
ncbi:MAG TPA: inorganic diphosphatase [Terriglobales bacterium]|nr:inorganic diphosphatase [Terriglobales bacterium]